MSRAGVLAVRAAFLAALVGGVWSVSHRTPSGPVEEVGEACAALDDLAGRLRAHVERLVGMGSRSWRHPETLARAATWIESTWEGLGWRVERQPVSELGQSYVNLIAFPDDRGWEVERVLLGAHYDAVEGTPGADDNASAVAVLLEVSRLVAAGACSRPAVFAAFTLEEPPFFQTPRQGSWVFARTLRREGVALAGAIVLEMVGYYSRRPGSQSYPFPLGWFGYPDRGDFCGLIANRYSRGLLPQLAAAIRGAGLPVETLAVPGKGHLLEPVRFSDHASFWDLGYRAVMITDTAFYRNPRYHGPDDTPETLDYESMARLTLGLARYLGCRPAEVPGER
ncbi:MAG: M28 family metallopeptidase [Deferrisomatales bacterium]